jgi:hypothetical protein
MNSNEKQMNQYNHFKQAPIAGQDTNHLLTIKQKLEKET